MPAVAQVGPVAVADRDPAEREEAALAELPALVQEEQVHRPHGSPRGPATGGVSSCAMQRRLGLALAAATTLTIALAVAAPAQAAYKAKITAGTLTLTGNAKSDRLTLRLKKGAPGILQVDVGSNGSADFAFARRLFTTIRVNAGGGNDTVTIVDKYGAFTTEEATELFGGAGNDKLNGGAGPETYTGGPGTDTIVGKAGDDLVLWAPGHGSDKVDGGADSDSVVATGTTGPDAVDVTAVGSRTRVKLGANVLDLGTVEIVDANVRGGADLISVADLSATATGRINLDLEAADGAARLGVRPRNLEWRRGPGDGRRRARPGHRAGRRRDHHEPGGGERLARAPGTRRGRHADGDVPVLARPAEPRRRNRERHPERRRTAPTSSSAGSATTRRTATAAPTR